MGGAADGEREFARERRALRRQLTGRLLHRVATRAGMIVGATPHVARDRAATCLPAPIVLGSVLLRPLDLMDSSAWRESRLANAQRMQKWWGEEDWEASCSRDAFLDHYLGWWVSRLKGSGEAWAIVSAGRLVGEVLVYFAGSDRRAELGLWMRPGGVGAAELVGLTGALIDRLVLHRGIERIDAPVNVGNRQPRRLLEIGGFTLEGTLANWRPVGNVRSDMDVYGLTARDWREKGRIQARAVCPWPDVASHAR